MCSGITSTFLHLDERVWVCSGFDGLKLSFLDVAGWARLAFSLIERSSDPSPLAQYDVGCLMLVKKKKLEHHAWEMALKFCCKTGNRECRFLYRGAGYQ